MFFSIAAAVHGAGTGMVAGTATDQEGHPITRATIRAVDVISGKELASTAVRPNASYAFEGVPEGAYYPAAQVPEYRPLVSKTVTVKAGETSPLELVLQSDLERHGPVSGLSQF